MDLQELSDRQEITDLITRYTRAVDTRSFGDLADVFTDDAVLDYSIVGGPAGTPDAVVPWIEKGLAGFDRFQHLVGQVSIDLDGDTASATAYFTNPMVSVGPDGTEKLWRSAATTTTISCVRRSAGAPAASSTHGVDPRLPMRVGNLTARP